MLPRFNFARIALMQAGDVINIHLRQAKIMAPSDEGGNQFVIVLADYAFRSQS